MSQNELIEETHLPTARLPEPPYSSGNSEYALRPFHSPTMQDNQTQ